MAARFYARREWHCRACADWAVGVVVSSFGPAALSGRLVKLLLADPLQPEQEWERLVEGSAMNGALGRLDQLLVR